MTALSLEDREREYSPSSCIGGDYAPFLRAYAELSAAALAGRAVQRDLPYGDCPTQRLDLFVPPASGADAPLPPLLVFIHGGYWQELSKASSLFGAPGAQGAGFAYAAIDYTLAPHASIGAIAIECRNALRWLHAHGAALGFDPSRILVAGSSAGAHLAAMCCVRGWTEDHDLPAGLPAAGVLVSGVYELEPLIGTSIDKALSLTPRDAARWSPMRLPLDSFPPTVVCWGEIETDEFERQSRAFADALAVAGAPRPELFEVPARNHFDVILDLSERGTLLGDATLRILESLRDRSP
ncbi:arylformamidase [Variovorax sp. HW608]|uniref:alpha/beta hydrolase n=1 Tax=Variovorax sp. HW608 TaxID=1034889 RepID=UPI00081FEF30|nr:alpha/beta hydrolase [Variovorax sp. HW608]SCK61710.1 arylformamidase [Variovorax sp. HW608]